MPQNNLLSQKYFLFCFFLVGVFAFSQSPIGIKSSVGEYYSISLCEGDVVTFTLDSFTTAPTSGENYIFYRVRTGGVTETVQSLSSSNTFNFNNLGFSVGLSLENFDIGILYNFGVKQIDKVYAPAILELYLTFDFSKFRRNLRGLFKRLQIDNYL
jgi:hypothetical protein